VQLTWGSLKGIFKQNFEQNAATFICKLWVKRVRKGSKKFSWKNGQTLDLFLHLPHMWKTHTRFKHFEFELEIMKTIWPKMYFFEATLISSGNLIYILIGDSHRKLIVFHMELTIFQEIIFCFFNYQINSEHFSELFPFKFRFRWLYWLIRINLYNT